MPFDPVVTKGPRFDAHAVKPLSSSLHLGLAVEPGPGIQATLPRSPIKLLVLQGLFFWPAFLLRLSRMPQVLSA